MVHLSWIVCFFFFKQILPIFDDHRNADAEKKSYNIPVKIGSYYFHSISTVCSRETKTVNVRVTSLEQLSLAEFSGE
jgi:hypothetical protein